MYRHSRNPRQVEVGSLQPGDKFYSFGTLYVLLKLDPADYTVSVSTVRGGNAYRWTGDRKVTLKRSK